jgi:ABC-2 type transport system permease protein
VSRPAGDRAGAAGDRAGAVLNTLRVMRYAFLSGTRDYGSIYTPTTWLFGWFLRVLAQVTFFALIGRLLRAEEQTWFLLVGNAVMLAAMEGVWAINMVSWERNTGTLPLLVASPTSAVVVLASRGAYLIADGVVSALGALFLIGALFGLPMPWPEILLVVPLTVLVGASAYCFGTFLGGVLLGYRSLNGLVANVGLVTLMTLCGVNVPLAAYPEPVTWVSQVLPLTHGLIAIRAVLDGRLGAAAVQALAEAAVGAGWFAACLLTFGWFIGRGRRTGSLDFAT